MALNFAPNLDNMRPLLNNPTPVVHKANVTQITNINTAIHAAIVNAGGVGTVCTQAQFNEGLRYFLHLCANIGTSRNTDWEALTITVSITTRAVPAVTPTAFDAKSVFIDPILTETTVRRYCRTYANAVYNWGKSMNRSYHIGTLHGVPRNLGYIGFDFADGITPGRLTDPEEQALSAARAIGIFRSGAITTNNHHLYHQGVAPTRPQITQG